MNPVVTAAVVVVGALAAAIFYVINDPPRTQRNYNSHYGETHHTYNFNAPNSNNTFSNGRSGTQNETTNRRRPRKKVTVKNDTCAICWEDLTVPLEVLPCEHALHTKCFEDYSKSERDSGRPIIRCPLCRESVD